MRIWITHIQTTKGFQFWLPKAATVAHWWSVTLLVRFPLSYTSNNLHRMLMYDALVSKYFHKLFLKFSLNAVKNMKTKNMKTKKSSYMWHYLIISRHWQKCKSWLMEAVYFDGQSLFIYLLIWVNDLKFPISFEWIILILTYWIISHYVPHEACLISRAVKTCAGMTKFFIEKPYRQYCCHTCCRILNIRNEWNKRLLEATWESWV